MIFHVYTIKTLLDGSNVGAIGVMLAEQQQMKMNILHGRVFRQYWLLPGNFLLCLKITVAKHWRDAVENISYWDCLLHENLQTAIYTTVAHNIHYHSTKSGSIRRKWRGSVEAIDTNILSRLLARFLNRKVLYISNAMIVQTSIYKYIRWDV